MGPRGAPIAQRRPTSSRPRTASSVQRAPNSAEDASCSAEAPPAVAVGAASTGPPSPPSAKPARMLPCAEEANGEGSFGEVGIEGLPPQPNKIRMSLKWRCRAMSNKFRAFCPPSASTPARFEMLKARITAPPRWVQHL